MKKISSKSTFVHKKIFPCFWFGFLVVFLIIGLKTGAAKNDVGFLLVPAFMAVFGFFIMKKLIWDLVDEVFDCGDHLLVKNKGTEERIDFRSIMNVSYALYTNPPRVTLTIRSSSGQPSRDISFTPPFRFNFFSKDPLIQDLIERIDRARG